MESRGVGGPTAWDDTKANSSREKEWNSETSRKTNMNNILTALALLNTLFEIATLELT